jgi:uncharacterized protein (DUF302 family)
MSYYISKILHVTFDKAMSNAIEELRKEGFGILTEIDVTETLKRKLNVDFPNYTILGACNPPFAYRALHELLQQPARGERAVGQGNQARDKKWFPHKGIGQ